MAEDSDSTPLVEQQVVVVVAGRRQHSAPLGVAKQFRSLYAEGNQLLCIMLHPSSRATQLPWE